MLSNGLTLCLVCPGCHQTATAELCCLFPVGEGRSQITLGDPEEGGYCHLRDGYIHIRCSLKPCGIFHFIFAGVRWEDSNWTCACNMHAMGCGYPAPVSSLTMSLSAAVVRSCYPSVLVYRALHGVLSRDVGLMTGKTQQGFTRSYLQMILLISQGKNNYMKLNTVNSQNRHLYTLINKQMV